MKQWTLPKKYQQISHLDLFPLCFDRKAEVLEWMETDSRIQSLLGHIGLVSYTTGDIYEKENDEDERLRISRLISGKNFLIASIGYILMEKLGYDVGKYPPSKFFSDFPIPQTPSLEFVLKGNDVYGKFRAAVFDWGIYVNVNDLGECLNSYWFNSEKNIWRNETRKNDVKLIFV